MADPEPRVPGDDTNQLELPCGESLDPHEIDLGMREYSCSCGDRHAVVTDVHPPSRFVPESLVAVLQETVDTADDFDEFGTPHLLGIVMEEFPDEVVVHDASEDGSVGYTLLWVTDFEARRLHVVVVELIVELMEHAISHADDGDAITEFETQMLEFDVESFVDQYRDVRDFESEHDAPV
ncbi:DUF5815 family protein [Natronosalvus halobius]|uniref:DUF5815 family protein n=1 Tax=Natronosalvus halobius TaxID=2953746 RepID=UPI00209D68E7|nr:DUF5815 family protein [Natronosalvus halobius]USZ72100.1 DUF5815 family protein [Natronosalvus halobius]